MGFWSSLGDFCSSVCSAVSSCVHTLGKVATSVFDGIAEVAVRVGSVAFRGIVGLIGSLVGSLGVVPKSVKPEELGARVLQHPEINREDFESYNAYKNELLKASLNKEEFEKGLENEQTKLEYQIAGIELEHNLLQEKYNMVIDPKLWEMAEKKKMNVEDCKVMLDSLSNNKVQIGAFVGYVNDPESMEKTVEMDSALDEMKKGGVTIFDK